jgi:hypothetical protein
MKTEVIQDMSVTIKVVNMHPGQIGKLRDTDDELYVVRQEFGFLQIWPKLNCFESASVLPDNWDVSLLPEGTVVKITSN